MMKLGKIKIKLVECLSSLIKLFEQWKSRLTSEEENIKTQYSSLSPIDNCDKDGYYTEALSWALENRKKQDIKNIALTGPYGSGKSSILKTFQKNYKEKELKFLNISLATFKEEKQKFDSTGNAIENNDANLLRLIEISILQQIFYHEKDKNIPDSRFKKIRSYSKIQLIVTGIGYLLFSLSVYNFFYPNFVESIFKDFEFSKTIKNVVHYVGFGIILTGIFFLIYKSVRIISSITVNKLKIQNTEIGLGDNLNKSILNHHLDEILYFFSVRPYNVVIIEDLDRFQETEIFTKLREINLLLNNSLKTKKKEIVFIYAVRDNMFTDKERTKFFDFIIPVIPTINSSNSSEKLLEKKRFNNFNLSDSFIEDIAFVIDDMRLLHNICNEFSIYKKQLGKNIEDIKFSEKLFAIITYKNIHPNDFVRLSENKGFLFNVLNSKKIYVRKKTNILENEIKELKEEIINLEGLFFENIRDVRKLYILKTIEKLDKFQSFVVNNNSVNIEQLVEDSNFEYLTKDELKYNKWTHRGGYYGEEITIASIDTKFTDIENEVNSVKTYKKIEQEINERKSGKINAIKNKIQELEKEKTNIRNSKIAEILQSTNEVLNFEELNNDLEDKKEKFNEDLIRLLVRNGYIAEDYLDYISIFHEGSITRSDHLFLINIKNKNRQEFDYSLNKTQKISSKISPSDFATEYVLNYNLIDFLLTKPSKYKNQIDSIFTALKNESETSIQFIKEFIENSENIEKFIKMICNHWVNIWNFFSENETYNDDQKNKLFIHIIDYAEISSIKQIAQQSNFRQIIIGNPDFLGIIQNEEKLKNIIKALDLEFEELNFSNSPDELIKFIYENNYYQLNVKMIASIVKKFGEFNQVSFDNSNSLAVNQSECQYLIEYVNENINEYVENVHLKIESNVNEDEETFIELLNNKELNEENKIKIIEKTETKITNIESISDIDIQSSLIENNNIIAKWKNLLTEFNDQEEITESIIDFINIKENAEELSKKKIPTKVEEKNIYGVFWKKLIEQNTIEDESYDLILKSNPWWYEDLELASLSQEKTKLLIEKNIIQPTIKSFDLIKESHPELTIKLIEKHTKKYIEIIDELSLDSSDISLILKSTKLSESEKNKFVNSCSEDELISNVESLKLINQILIESSSNFQVSSTLIEEILLNESLSSKEKIKLFINNPSILPSSKYDDFIDNLDVNYRKINNRDTIPVIENTSLNKRLLEIFVESNFISSYSLNKKGLLRVNHKRNI